MNIIKQKKYGKQDDAIKKNNSNRHTKNSLTKDFGYHNKDDGAMLMGNMGRPYNTNVNNMK